MSEINPARRERLNPDWPIKVNMRKKLRPDNKPHIHNFPARLLPPDPLPTRKELFNFMIRLPDVAYRTAINMRTIWNELCAMHKQMRLDLGIEPPDEAIEAELDRLAAELKRQPTREERKEALQKLRGQSRLVLLGYILDQLRH